MFKGIDLYSDTLTKPSAGMKKAMMEAPLGDEQKGEDPTTRALEEKVAELLGKSSAMFFPSATMANEVALKLFISPGDELLAWEHCHLLFAEAGGPAVHAQAMVRAIRSENGIFTGDDVRKTYREAKGSHYPVSKLVSVENTTNMGGGVAWPLATLDSVVAAAKELSMKSHLDGSRLFNAVVRTQCPPVRIAGKFDSTTVCLSKGLGCATGAVLAFDKEHWTQVRRLKQLMGGAMRQSGILAAAGLYALENNISRLEEDHKNAQALAEGLCSLPGVAVENLKPSTNMVFFRWENTLLTTEQFLAAGEQKGVRFSSVGGNRIRAVTHLDITASDIAKALSILRDVCGNL